MEVDWRVSGDRPFCWARRGSVGRVVYFAAAYDRV
jgi:hypothetical protein